MSDTDSSSSITRLIRLVEAGDHDAASELWDKSYPQLLQYCRGKLPDRLRRVLDEEDVALSAFKSFCLRAEKGSFGVIDGRDSFWRLLYSIASRKAAGYVRDQYRQKRGGGRVVGESGFGHHKDDGPGKTINDVEDSSGGEFSLEQFSLECQSMLDALEDEVLQTVALLRVEGYSVEEIADRVGCAKRTVERRLRLIREIWQSL